LRTLFEPTASPNIRAFQVLERLKPFEPTSPPRQPSLAVPVQSESKGLDEALKALESLDLGLTKHVTPRDVLNEEDEVDEEWN
jgi:hypothetical protein